jgi:ABC-2 type transport system permease protein
MWKEIVNFELAYRKKRPATYVYFGILFLMGFLLVSTSAIEMMGTGGPIKENGTRITAQIFSFVSVFSIFIVSGIMGVAILRDFEHRTEAIFLTTNLSKFDYLFGRFVGSFIVLFYVSLGIPLGIMLGDLMPWRDHTRMLPFQFLSYLYNYCIFILPNIFITASVFFMVGALSHKMIVVYMQGVTFLLLYFFTGSLLGQMDKREIGALLDPIGIRAMSLQTRYWSIAQKNHDFISLKGDFLYNRLFWIAIGVLCLSLTYRLFSLQQVLNPLVRKKIKVVKSRPELLKESMPQVVKKFDNYFLQVTELTKVHYQNVVKDLPFIGLTLCGIMIFVFTSTTVKGWYGTTVVPSTYKMLESMSILTGFFPLILTIIYIGDLVWKERELRMNLIHDTLPISNITVMIGKLLGLTLAFCTTFLIAIFISVTIQTFKGYHDYQFGVYFKELFGGSLISMIIFMLLGFFVHSLVNNKFWGHGIMVLIIMIVYILQYWVVGHTFLRFNPISSFHSIISKK